MTDEDKDFQEDIDAEARYKQGLTYRVEDLVSGFIAYLTQMRASNTEALSAAYTLATRLTKSTMAVYPAGGAEMRPLALQLLMETANRAPIDVEVVPVPSMRDIQ